MRYPLVQRGLIALVQVLAMGVLIGALTLGSALPHLVGGLWRLD